MQGIYFNYFTKLDDDNLCKYVVQRDAYKTSMLCLDPKPTPILGVCMAQVVETRTTSMHRLSHKNHTQRYYHGFGSTCNNFGFGFVVIIYLRETY